MADLFNEISNAINNYFDGLYQSDVSKLSSVFHPDCHLFSSTGGYLNWSRDEWLEAVSNRNSPEKLSLNRHDRIISIDIADQNTAFAKVQIAIPPRFFTDYLSFLRLEGDWQIVSKTFRTEIHK
tara:strand:- start:112 stop:483 length:372 start_codon:yes stop_codon:yes gene_type:complete